MIHGLKSQLEAEGFDIEAEMYAKSKKNGFDVQEIPIDYLMRAGDTKLGSLKDGYIIWRRLLKERFQGR